MGFFIIGRVIYLQFFEAEKWKDTSEKLTLKNFTIGANRGNICARDGKLLATSVPFYEVRLDLMAESITKEVFRNNIDSLSLCLSNLFEDKTPYEYKKIISDARKKENRYFLLKRKISYDQFKTLKTFPIFRMGKYKGGIIAIRQDRRIFPYGLLANRTIGYTTRENKNKPVGIEGSYDHFLKGTEGVRLMRRMAGGVWMPVNDENLVEPEDGKDIITTIDINIQDVAESALANQLNLHNAHHGCAVLMEVATGEIKAMANLERTKNGEYVESYNYAIGESTEPGSTFKLPALMAAIEDGYININDTFDTKKGKIKYYDHMVEDSHEGGYGKISVRQIFEVSSNVGVSRIITKYYKGKEDRFIDRIYSMNLNEKLGMEVSGEGKPEIKYPTDRMWSGVSLPMISFGYEIRLTPLQILTFYNAVANDGIMIKPILIKEIQFHGQSIQKFEPKIINPSICSKRTLKQARIMLEGVVKNGTAKNLSNCNYQIAGKTGTAQVANTRYGYLNKESKLTYQASFVGYFPADNPTYSCIVVVSSPSNDVYYGNLVAGPIFKEIADKVFSTSPDLQKAIHVPAKPIDIPSVKISYKDELDKVLKDLHIPLIGENLMTDYVTTVSSINSINYKEQNYTSKVIPDVKGMGAKDALFLLENKGLTVVLSGRGIVTEQSKTPGEPIKKGDVIRLNLVTN